eukprot:TRINITY_DN65211_c0_g1_i1.p1 TRINITY_DN65211_c0_g1~~TRINITY_DN65211_c0_g1_i1.p1  ORF type:complete len:294 (+),score=12.59 TRINITY_DN65211_c0_g1_i1:102-884(+)
MDLCFSGEVSDAAFLERAERRWATVQSVQEAHGVVFYFRFKDDIIICMNAESCVRTQFCREINRHAEFFDVRCESVSSTEAVFLDVLVVFGPRWEATGILDVIPYSKPSSMWRPLSASSWHTMAVHYSWPIQHMARFCSRASNTLKLRQHLHGFINEFEAAEPDHCALQSMKRFASSAFPTRRTTRHTRRPSSSWMVIPFHPAWAFGPVRQAVNEVQRRWSCLLRTRPSLSINIAWALADKHHVLKVKHESSSEREVGRW